MGIFSKKRGMKEVSVAALLLYRDGESLDRMVRDTWEASAAAKVPNLGEAVAGLLHLTGGPIDSWGNCDESSWFAVDTNEDRLIPVLYGDSWALMPLVTPGHVATLAPLVVLPQGLPAEVHKRFADVGWPHLTTDHPYAKQIPL